MNHCWGQNWKTEGWLLGRLNSKLGMFGNWGRTGSGKKNELAEQNKSTNVQTAIPVLSIGLKKGRIRNFGLIKTNPFWCPLEFPLPDRFYIPNAEYGDKFGELNEFGDLGESNANLGRTILPVFHLQFEPQLFPTTVCTPFQHSPQGYNSTSTTTLASDFMVLGIQWRLEEEYLN